ncbi:hypothetical protein TNCV_3535151 [Trichonephila clavipes]|nr:hypothetical protein TNCV_3535151 [Trichonephila clavipes]
MECHAGSQRPIISSSRKNKHVTRMVNGSCNHVKSPESRIEVVFKTISGLHVQINYFCSSMGSQLGDHGCGYS